MSKTHEIRLTQLDSVRLESALMEILRTSRTEPQGAAELEALLELARAALVRGSDALKRQGLVWARQARAAAEHMGKQKPGASPKGVVVLRVTHTYVQTPGENAGKLWDEVAD